MSVDARIAYLDARAAYDRALAAAKAHCRMIESVGSSLKHSLAGFIETNIEAKRSSLHTAYDMTRWPDAAALIASFTAVKDAHAICVAAWADVPHEHHAGCVPPPKRAGEA